MTEIVYVRNANWNLVQTALKDLREDRLEQLEEENKKLKEDVDYFRQCYLDLKKLCEKEWFMLSDEEVTKMFNLDEIK